jgi:glycerol-3-phosphate dehydrogenase
MRVERILGSARSIADLGRDFGSGLTQAELDYLARDEWARTADDVLWRRSKLGLHVSEAQADAVANYVSSSRNGACAVSGIVGQGSR